MLAKSFTIKPNGQRYVFVADFEAASLSPVTNFDAGYYACITTETAMFYDRVLAICCFFNPYFISNSFIQSSCFPDFLIESTIS